MKGEFFERDGELRITLAADDVRDGLLMQQFIRAAKSGGYALRISSFGRTDLRPETQELLIAVAEERGETTLTAEQSRTILLAVRAMGDMIECEDDDLQWGMHVRGLARIIGLCPECLQGMCSCNREADKPPAEDFCHKPVWSERTKPRHNTRGELCGTYGPCQRCKGHDGDCSPSLMERGR